MYICDYDFKLFDTSVDLKFQFPATFITQVWNSTQKSLSYFLFWNVRIKRIVILLLSIWFYCLTNERAQNQSASDRWLECEWREESKDHTFLFYTGIICKIIFLFSEIFYNLSGTLLWTILFKSAILNWISLRIYIFPWWLSHNPKKFVDLVGGR